MSTLVPPTCYLQISPNDARNIFNFRSDRNFTPKAVCALGKRTSKVQRTCFLWILRAMQLLVFTQVARDFWRARVAYLFARITPVNHKFVLLTPGSDLVNLFLPAVELNIQ
jgi:hypothetical protein